MKTINENGGGSATWISQFVVNYHDLGEMQTVSEIKQHWENNLMQRELPITQCLYIKK